MKKNMLVFAVLITGFAGLYLWVTFFFQKDETTPVTPVEQTFNPSREMPVGKTKSPASSIGHKQSVPQTPEVPEGRDPEKASGTNSKPDTIADLGLKLRGIITSGESSSEGLFAVIETIRSGEQRLYRVGDRILNATITGIYQDTVVLEVNGMEKTLTIEGISGAQTENTLSDPEFDFSTTPSLENEITEKTPDQDDSSAKKNEESRPPATSIGKTKFGDQPDRVVYTPGEPIPVKLSRINDAFTDLDTLVKEVRVKPVYNEQEPEGFILTNIESTSVLKEIGLRIGDMITGINGQKIATVDEALTFYEGLSPGDQVSIQLKRRGRETTIDYIIEK